MRKRMMMSLALLAATASIYGQKRSVSGIVTDESGAVLSGATVRVKGGNGGTHTDENGRFVLSGVSDTDRLIISYIGMKPQTLEPQAKMTVVLLTDDRNLDEAIVVAFGEQKKSSFTGSAGVISSKALEQRQLTNVMDALQGNVAGLQAYSHSGAPDANPEFRIRGSFPPAFAFPPFGLPPSVPALRVATVRSCHVLKRGFRCRSRALSLRRFRPLRKPCKGSVSSTCSVSFAAWRGWWGNIAGQNLRCYGIMYKFARNYRRVLSMPFAGFRLCFSRWKLM